MRSLPLIPLVACLACGGEGGADAGDEEPGIPASGIHIDWVEANQGIGVAIGAQGGAVAPDQRSAYLVRHRPTLFRAFWTLEPSFTPREIEARLHLTTPEGHRETFPTLAHVAGPSFIGQLDTTFFWLVPEEFMRPGVNYDIELFEMDPTLGDPEALPNAFPLDGTATPVGIESAAARLRVVIVPIDYDDGAGCVTRPDTSVATIDRFRELLYMMSPVEAIDLEVRSPVAFREPLQSLASINMLLSSLRSEDGAPPEVFYYGLIDACRPSIDGALGQAFSVTTLPPLREQAYQRVSSGLWRSASLDDSAETFVHELGHSLGRLHVACDGESGVDYSYPVELGRLGEWGFGVLDREMRHPEFYADYMTYCHPAWVSTFGWNKVFPAVRELTSWTTADARPSTSRVLLGTVLPDGQEEWSVVPGTVAGLSAVGSRAFAFKRSPHEEHVEGLELALPEPDAARMFAVQLPEDLEGVQQILRMEGAQRIEIPRAAIRRYPTSPILSP